MDEERDGGINGVQPPTVDIMSSPTPLSFRRWSPDDFQFTAHECVCVCVCVCVCMCVFLLCLAAWLMVQMSDGCRKEGRSEEQEDEKMWRRERSE